MTLSALLTDATTRLVLAGIPAAEARTEARMLVQHAFGLTREQLILRPDTELDVMLLEPFLSQASTWESVIIKSAIGILLMELIKRRLMA